MEANQMDLDLVKALRNGESGALLELIERYSQKVHNLAMRITRSEEDTEGKGPAGDETGGRIAHPKGLAESLGKAREAISGRGSTWGAYHHYGQATDTLIIHEEPSPQKRRARPRKRK